MTVVVGTAGHIDHGKTTLLRALTGIDADRLPEERRRGMTIDVGYAHLAFDDGLELDFVDVPGHDRLVGNMLVGAGEIDAALLVVAADDGPRAQTTEHLELLDALGVGDGVVAITKADLVGPARLDEVADAVRALLRPTSLAGAVVVPVAAPTGAGLDALVLELGRLRDRVVARTAGTRPPTRLAIDRSFSVRGRGSVVTGTLRGGQVGPGATLRLEPSGGRVRVREVQVHGRPVGGVDDGGRVALNVAGVEPEALRRGAVLTDGPAVVASDRLAVVVRAPAALAAGGSTRRPLVHDETLRLHLGTEQVAARVRRGRRDAASFADGTELVRLVLERPIAVVHGDRFVLRRPSPAATAAGGRVVDTAPPVGVARRRATPERLARLAEANHLNETLTALVELHGVLAADRADALRAAYGLAAGEVGEAGLTVGGWLVVGGWFVAPDVGEPLREAAVAALAGFHEAEPSAAGMPLGELRRLVGGWLRRSAALSPDDAIGLAGLVVDGLVDAGQLARTGDLVRDPARAPGLPPSVLAAMDRLETVLAVPAPPPIAEAARAAGCPPDGVRALESAGRIVRVDAELAWAASTYAELTALALRMATGGPLAPAAFRDATRTSRRYSLAILEDLDRRDWLRRTPEGHVLGPRAPRP